MKRFLSVIGVVGVFAYFVCNINSNVQATIADILKQIYQKIEKKLDIRLIKIYKHMEN